MQPAINPPNRQPSKAHLSASSGSWGLFSASTRSWQHPLLHGQIWFFRATLSFALLKQEKTLPESRILKNEPSSQEMALQNYCLWPDEFQMLPQLLGWDVPWGKTLTQNCSHPQCLLSSPNQRNSGERSQFQIWPWGKKTGLDQKWCLSSWWALTRILHCRKQQQVLGYPNASFTFLLLLFSFMFFNSNRRCLKGQPCGQRNSFSMQDALWQEGAISPERMKPTGHSFGPRSGKK